MGFDLRKILELAPLAVGALKPGSPEAAAMMRGFLRSQQQIQQQQQIQGRYQQQDERLARLDELSASNLLADNQRQDQAAKLQREQFDINKLEKFRTAGSERGQELIAGADLGASPTDPSLQNQVATDLFGLSKQYGVDPAAAQTVLPNTAARLSVRKKKHAEDLYAEALKRFAPKDDNGNVTDWSWENRDCASNLQSPISNLTSTFGPHTGHAPGCA